MRPMNRRTRLQRKDLGDYLHVADHSSNAYSDGASWTYFSISIHQVYSFGPKLLCVDRGSKNTNIENNIQGVKKRAILDFWFLASMYSVLRKLYVCFTSIYKFFNARKVFKKKSIC